MSRSIFSRLCKTCAAALLLAALSSTANAQITTAAAAQPDAVRVVPAQKLKIAGVPNAGKISEALFRGAQPSSQGFAELKKLGVTTIVDLRGNSGEAARERRQAESLGMRFIDIPIRGWSAPSNANVAQFLELFQGDPQQKIFVHCYYGEDRTGVMVAIYRIAQENWTADQAIAEMVSFGFHYHLYPGMKSYVRRFPATLSSEPLFAPLRPKTTQR